MKRLLPGDFRVELRKFLKRWLIGVSSRRIAGPANPKLAANDAVVLCLVKNGENYVQSFICHHLSPWIQAYLLFGQWLQRPNRRTCPCGSDCTPISAQLPAF